MLVASRLDGIAASVTVGTTDDAVREHFVRRLDAVDWSAYGDRIVVIKGCGTTRVPESAYVTAMAALQQSQYFCQTKVSRFIRIAYCTINHRPDHTFHLA